MSYIFISVGCHLFGFNGHKDTCFRVGEDMVDNSFN